MRARSAEADNHCTSTCTGMHFKKRTGEVRCLVSINLLTSILAMADIFICLYSVITGSVKRIFVIYDIEVYLIKFYSLWHSMLLDSWLHSLVCMSLLAPLGLYVCRFLFSQRHHRVNLPHRQDRPVQPVVSTC